MSANRATQLDVPSFGRFMVAITIAMSLVTLVDQFDHRAAWFLVWVILLSMVLTQDRNLTSFVTGLSDFVNNVLSSGGTRNRNNDPGGVNGAN